VISPCVTVLRSEALINSNIGIVNDDLKIVAEIGTYARNLKLEVGLF